MNRARNGSSTVLVILIIVLLVSLSVLSVGISNSGYRLSKRMSEQFRDYYLLESEADRCFAEAVGMPDGEITAERLLGIGCVNPVVEADRVSFDVVLGERSFHVEFSRGDYRILAWYEAERIFETELLEYGDIKR